MTTDYVILLTGSIIPSEKADIVISDPKNRLMQYCQGIRFWSNLTDTQNKIIFIDNSGYGRIKILEALSKFGIPDLDAIDIISHYMNEIPKGLHYGYAELSIIDFALKNLTKLQQSKYFIKATGRLTFPTIGRLLKILPEHFIFAVDTRENNYFVKKPQRFVTTQLMLFNTQFYIDNLIGIQQEMSPQANLIENLFYNKLTQYRDNPKAILRWPVSVDPTGYAAHWDKNYNDTRKRIINTVRSLLRVLAPNWWI